MNRFRFNQTRLNGPWGWVHLYLPYELTSVALTIGNVNPFGVDPERTTSITVGNVNPFGVDPERTTLITTGL